MEFLVASIERDGEGYCARGVCIQGRLEIGASFSRAYRKIFRKNLNDEFELVGIDNDREIKLRIEKIIAYRRVLDSLPLGMSGEIYLTGAGGDSLHDKDTLASG